MIILVLLREQLALQKEYFHVVDYMFTNNEGTYMLRELHEGIYGN